LELGWDPDPDGEFGREECKGWDPDPDKGWDPDPDKVCDPDTEGEFGREELLWDPDLYLDLDPADKVLDADARRYSSSGIVDADRFKSNSSPSPINTSLSASLMMSSRETTCIKQ
jgi:hypothetical protein